MFRLDRVAVLSISVRPACCLGVGVCRDFFCVWFFMCVCIKLLQCFPMLYLGYVKYICQYVPFVFLQNTRFHAEDCVLVVASQYLYYVSLFLKYSYFFQRCTLVDLGGYDVPVSVVPQTPQTSAIAATSGFTPVQYTPTMWYIFKDINGVRLFIFSLQTVKSKQQSIDLLFRNARWLEREATDFFGFFFTAKSDRRSLYTLPLFYNAPFRRKYPAVGFYELFFCPILKKLKFKHLSLQV